MVDRRMVSWSPEDERAEKGVPFGQEELERVHLGAEGGCGAGRRGATRAARGDARRHTPAAARRDSGEQTGVGGGRVRELRRAALLLPLRSAAVTLPGRGPWASLGLRPFC